MKVTIGTYLITSPMKSNAYDLEKVYLVAGP